MAIRYLQDTATVTKMASNFVHLQDFENRNMIDRLPVIAHKTLYRNNFRKLPMRKQLQ